MAESNDVTVTERIEGIAHEVVVEVKTAMILHKPMCSIHDGYGVILEVVEELWDEIRKKNPNMNLVRREAIQVAAMGIRFVNDICLEDKVVDEDNEKS